MKRTYKTPIIRSITIDTSSTILQGSIEMRSFRPNEIQGDPEPDPEGRRHIDNINDVW